MLLGMVGLVLTACGHTVAGSAHKAVDPSNPDDVVVEMLKTGDYPTTAGHIFGTAGDAGNFFEGQRMAEYVVGPWVVDSTLRQPEALETQAFTGELLPSGNAILADPFPDIARTHGLVAGFTTARTTSGRNPLRDLVHMVMRFPDPASASAAAREMADRDDGNHPADFSELGPAPRHPLPITSQPEAIAWSYDRADGAVEVHSYAAHGTYVFLQRAFVLHEPYDNQFEASTLVSQTLRLQGPLIDRFTPTDLTKLKDLPKDPSGRLLAHVLTAPDGAAPRSIGVWPPGAALHFENDPVASDTLFKDAGVQWMGQQLTRVYEARDVGGAGRVVDKLVRQTKALPDVEAVSTKVPGMPRAQCFVRINGYALPQDAATIKQARWRYQCIARADRYAFAAFTVTDLDDVMHQASAQWRILAGK